VSASLTNKVFYANPTTAASKKFIKAEVANNPTVFLTDENLAKMIGSSDLLNNEIRRQQNRVYTSFKTGL
jgi:putrescine transport system substrate-binding protein